MLKNILVYPAVSGKSGHYAVRFLKSHSIPIIEHPSPEITHLLLDVPGKEIPDELLERLPENLCIVGGNLDIPSASGYQKIDLLENEWYLARNASITAECALQAASEKMDIVFSGVSVLVIGWGRIGKCLAQLLRAIGAEVTVAARKERDRVMAEALGYSTSLPGLVPDNCRVIFNTAPFPVMEEAANCLNIDLASRQGIFGSTVVWARGLPGKYAPESSGKLIGEAFLREVTK